MEKKKYTIDDLLEILKVLRGENGCPWDRAQTHESIKKSMIEETYEAIDALDSGDDQAFSNELGDVLLQVAFHATLAKERGAFDFDDVVREICTKLITRHTHVFGEDKAVSAEEALGNWERNKKKEKNLKSDTELLNDVPHGLPALMRAQKVQKKAAACTNKQINIKETADKIKALTDRAAENSFESSEEMQTEYGKLLFEVSKLGQALKADAETALAYSTNKFIHTFAAAEEILKNESLTFAEISPKKMDDLWKKAMQKS